MIMGQCPYCDSSIMTPLAPDPLPRFSKEICDTCKKEYWLKHSRYDPIAYPLDDIDVDEVNKIVKIRGDKND